MKMSFLVEISNRCCIWQKTILKKSDSQNITGEIIWTNNEKYTNTKIEIMHTLWHVLMKWFLIVIWGEKKYSRILAKNNISFLFFSSILFFHPNAQWMFAYVLWQTIYRTNSNLVINTIIVKLRITIFAYTLLRREKKK